jgi:hypothetical protein
MRILMADFTNPFRPGAGHTPPYLAGRNHETSEFIKLLEQKIILKNSVITGLRGVGKTVLLDSLKPLAIKKNWLWIGTDLSESACISEDSMATRLCADLSIISSSIVVKSEEIQPIGFQSNTKTIENKLDFNTLMNVYNSTPGLSLDKIKTVIEVTWNAISQASDNKINGIVFAYDEAQNLSDQAKKEQFPLSLLLDAFQSLQKKNIPVLLVLTGLPTLFPKLVESRTYSERMFRVMFLKSLNEEESRKAILQPIKNNKCPLKLSNNSVATIVEMSGGYPYFIQFICREVYDSFIQKIDNGEDATIPVNEIEQKLDTDFFAGRWAKATDRQRELLLVVAYLDCPDEFKVLEVVEKSKKFLEKPFGSSNVNQMLNTLISQGLIFRNRHGKYSFAVPLLDRYIKREYENRA